MSDAATGHKSSKRFKEIYMVLKPAFFRAIENCCNVIAGGYIFT